MRCAAVARVSAADGGAALSALYWGGPEFVPDSESDAGVQGDQFPIEVSRYADDSFEHGMAVSRALSVLEPERQALFDRLIAALGV